jgi:hypothetical protein
MIWKGVFAPPYSNAPAVTTNFAWSSRAWVARARARSAYSLHSAFDHCRSHVFVLLC